MSVIAGGQRHYGATLNSSANSPKEGKKSIPRAGFQVQTRALLEKPEELRFWELFLLLSLA